MVRNTEKTKGMEKEYWRKEKGIRFRGDNAKEEKVSDEDRK
jgi:hypothetical protein